MPSTRGRGTKQALCSYKLRFDFTTPAGSLAYLDGKAFALPDVWFAGEFRKGTIGKG